MSLSKIINDYFETLPDWVHTDCIFPSLKETLYDSGYLKSEQELEILEQVCIQKGCLVAKLNYLLHLNRNHLSDRHYIFTQVNIVVNQIFQNKDSQSALLLETTAFMMLQEANGILKKYKG
jgi:hypothetical protein